MEKILALLLDTVQFWHQGTGENVVCVAIFGYSHLSQPAASPTFSKFFLVHIVKIVVCFGGFMGIVN